MPPSARSLSTPLDDGAPDDGVTETAAAAAAAAVALFVAVSTFLAMDIPGGRFGRPAGAGGVADGGRGAGARWMFTPGGRFGVAAGAAGFCRLIPGGSLGPGPPPLTTCLASSGALCIEIPGGRVGLCC